MFSNIHKKRLVLASLLSKVEDLLQASNLFKRDYNIGVSYGYCGIFKNSFTILLAAFDYLSTEQ